MSPYSSAYIFSYYNCRTLLGNIMFYINIGSIPYALRYQKYFNSFGYLGIVSLRVSPILPDLKTADYIFNECLPSILWSDVAKGTILLLFNRQSISVRFTLNLLEIAGEASINLPISLFTIDDNSLSGATE